MGRGGGMEGGKERKMDGETVVEIEKGGEKDRGVLCKVGFCMWMFICGCYRSDTCWWS